MTTAPTREATCARLGIPDRELVDIIDSPAGPIYHLADGTALIDVPADHPDHDGKVGLMFAVAPATPGGYKGNFPIYTNPPEGDPQRDTGTPPAGDDIDQLDKHQLAEIARDLGIEDASAKWTKARLVDAITEASAAHAQAAADADPNAADPNADPDGGDAE